MLKDLWWFLRGWVRGRRGWAVVMICYAHESPLRVSFGGSGAPTSNTQRAIRDLTTEHIAHDAVIRRFGDL